MSRALGLGAVLYVLSALADIHLTVAGMRGAADLEGNPVMRAMMARFGLEAGLWIEKTLVGIPCVLVAHYGVREMKRRAPWIDRIPSTKWAREWVKSGDRSWVAYAPLYGTALGQFLAALSWFWLGAR